VADPGRPIVVVADDDEAIRSLFRQALERAGFHVLPAADGRRALDLLRTSGADVLLLDLTMPGLSGLDTLNTLRADAAIRKVPVIIVTGSADEADRMLGLDQGADDVLVKPVSLTELVARVRVQIRGRAALADELSAGRELRRRLGRMLSELPRQADLVGLATALAAQLPSAVGVDGAAILVFDRRTVRCVAASAGLRQRFPPGRAVPQETATGITLSARAGPWVAATPDGQGANGEPIELAFVPFSLAEPAEPIGCFVYARTNAEAAPFAGRIAQLIDATESAVTALRPVIEYAETTSAAVLALRRLIAGREFAVHLQPIVRLDSGDIVGYEALTRFNDGVRPDLRFAEANRLGLGRALERAAIGAAIEAIAPLPSAIALSVNVSPDVLRHERTLPEVVQQAQRPVIIELTEHERIDDYAAVRASFERLGGNVRLAVDDAGSGYASLRHILALQPSYVKLDIEWVRGIQDDPVRRSLVSGLAHFADETRCELIAEGVETEQERSALIELGVRLGQGFLLGRPAPAATTGPNTDFTR
jgi:EAL domain-containing protein (putative c-di-GMP-specific phosphodiesterase class I)/DNA-binding NarL/FixJ family response regulator